MFYCAIPVGTALGYIYGGLMEKYADWRQGFLLMAALMLPFSVTCFFVENELKTASDAPAKKGSRLQHKARGTSVMEAVKKLVQNRVWLASSLGYAAWTFTIGAFAVWGPTYIHKVTAPRFCELSFDSLVQWLSVSGGAGV